MGQAWPRFFLTLREFIEALVFPRLGSVGPSMAMVFLIPLRYVGVLIYPRHGFEGPRKAVILYNP